MIIYENKKLVFIATLQSQNIKTGNMITVWILQKELPPHIAVKQKKDSLTCGDCQLRSGNGCYVTTWQAPLQVYKSWKAGKYPKYNVNVFKDKYARFGGYGDPAFLPIKFVKEITKVAKGFTGYTAQWTSNKFNADYLKYFMASVHNTEQLELLKTKFPEARYFRIVEDEHVKKYPNECICFNYTADINCIDCLKCNAFSNINILIPKHGVRKFRINSQ